MEDMEWQRTKQDAPPLPPDDQSLPTPVEEVDDEVEEEEEASTPAELERYGGGDSPSITVRLGGGRMHFW